MSDIVDQANDLIEFMSTHQIKKAPTLEPTGFCYFCDEPVERLFCDADCRDDFQKEQIFKTGKAY